MVGHVIYLSHICNETKIKCQRHAKRKKKKEKKTKDKHLNTKPKKDWETRNS